MLVVFENISISASPDVLNENGTGTVDRNDVTSLTLTCMLQSSFLVPITWTRNGTEVTGLETERVMEGGLEVQSVLEVNVSALIGPVNYACAANDPQNITVNVTITVNGKGRAHAIHHPYPNVHTYMHTHTSHSHML